MLKLILIFLSSSDAFCRLNQKFVIKTRLFSNVKDVPVILFNQDKLTSLGDSINNFDLASAITLAGYAFDSYNEPPTGKVSKGSDGTDIIFTSSDFIRAFFDGVLLIDLQNGKIDAKEEDLLESIATGKDPDPYVVMTIQDGEYRQIDFVQSSTKVYNTVLPVWNETHFLYIKNIQRANITFRVMDKDLYKNDDFIANGSMPLKQLLEQTGPRVNDVRVPIPIYVPLPPPGWSMLPPSLIPKFKRKGTIVIKARFIPWLEELPATNTNPSITEMGSDVETDTTITSSTLTSASSNSDRSRQISTWNRSSSNRRGNTTSLLFNATAAPGTLPNWSPLLDIIYEMAVNKRNELSSTTIQSSSSLTVSAINNIPLLRHGLRKAKQSPPRPSFSSSTSQQQEEEEQRAYKKKFDDELRQQCFIQNLDTDTQVALWADRDPLHRQIVIAFRGTEQSKPKDLLTDIDIAQVPFLLDGPEKLAAARVHRGFLRSFRSVSAALLQILRGILIESNSSTEVDCRPWTVYITGHSLGGALASLLALELARVTRELFGSSSSSASSLSSETSFYSRYDTASCYSKDKDFLAALKDTEIVLYTYGAPRVGNNQFAQLLDEMVPHYFRVVNNKDVVARLPRAKLTNSLLEYVHAGRTVMVDDDQLGALWVQGVDPTVVDGLGGGGLRKDQWCPVEDVSPFELLGEVEDMSVGSGGGGGDDTGRTTAIGSKEDVDAAWLSLQRGWELGQQQLINLFNSSTTSIIDTTKKKSMTENTDVVRILRGIFDLTSMTTSTISSLNASLSSPSSFLALLNNATASAAANTMSTASYYDKLLNIDEIRQRAIDLLAISQLRSSATIEKIGFSADIFLKQELRLLTALLDGRALQHHMEDSYYNALCRAAGLDKASESYLSARMTEDEDESDEVLDRS